MKWVIVVGASSVIARHVAACYSLQGINIILAGRDMEELALIQNDLEIRNGNPVNIIYWDASNTSSHGSFQSRCVSIVGSDQVGVLFFSGSLLDNFDLMREEKYCREVIEANYTGIVTTLNSLILGFPQLQLSFITVLTSVAGDRGRKSNFIYGSCKAAMNTYLNGLTGYLEGVPVIIIKAGFIDTTMTWGSVDSILTASPKGLAKKIMSMNKLKSRTMYYPFFWRYIMLGIRIIPASIFHRLNI